ncbi:MAG: metallophosphoesterase family protein [Anaerolineae bacterium]
MRIAVLSDIHANLPALEAVLADARDADVDGYVVAGDLVVPGPHPNAVIERLHDAGASSIRGNNDDYVLSFARGEANYMRASDQCAPIVWTHKRLGRLGVAALAELPGERTLALGNCLARLVHDAPGLPTTPLYPDNDAHPRARARMARWGSARNPLHAMMATLSETLLVCGHTHTPWQESHEGRLALNPGSVGGPVHGDYRAQYALLSDTRGPWQVVHRKVAYDLGTVIRGFRETGALTEGGAFARAFLLNVLTGENVCGHLVRHAIDVASAEGSPSDPAVPNAIWHRAAHTFPWEAYERRVPSGLSMTRF